MLTKSQKNIASFIHVGVFSKYLFPFGNFIIPLLIWLNNKEKSEFIDENGKQALNFQISVTLYFIAIALISIPFVVNFVFSMEQLEHLHREVTFHDVTSFPVTIIVFTILGLCCLILFVLEIYATIYAAIKAHEGTVYNYPLSIKFLK